MKALREEEKNDPQSPQNVTNALFVGSTSDLQKLINGDEK